jgi:protein-disulfide isomerase
MSKGTKDRAAARRIVEQQKARERRRAVTVWTTVTVVAVLVIAGLIGWGVLAGQSDDDAGKLVVPSTAVNDGTAFAVGSGPVQVDIYEDFMCPACGQFESGADATIEKLVDSGRITVRYHPIAILDRASNGTEYSTRSAAASAAAAEGGKFREYHKVLFANQPAEGTDGLTDDRLIELGRSVGLTDQKFADAVTEGTYRPWVADVTEKASARGVTGTPTIYVDGKVLADRTAAGLEQAVG